MPAARLNIFSSFTTAVFAFECLRSSDRSNLDHSLRTRFFFVFFGTWISVFVALAITVSYGAIYLRGRPGMAHANISGEMAARYLLVPGSPRPDAGSFLSGEPFGASGA